MVPEGTTLHLLLIDSMNAFYDLQDATFHKVPQEEWEKKTLKLKTLIEIACRERNTTYQHVGQSYKIDSTEIYL